MNRSLSRSPKTVALSGQKAVKSTFTARENQGPAKLRPSLTCAPDQNRTPLLLSGSKGPKKTVVGPPSPGCQPPATTPSRQPTPLQRDSDCSSDSLLPREQPVEEKGGCAREQLCMDRSREGPGLQEGKTGMKSPGWQQR